MNYATKNTQKLTARAALAENNVMFCAIL